jgi:hypothetical protein
MKNLAIAILSALSALSLACGGYSSKSATPLQAGVMPAITELAPDNTNAGGPAFMLTVNYCDRKLEWHGPKHHPPECEPTYCDDRRLGNRGPRDRAGDRNQSGHPWNGHVRWWWNVA